MPVDIEWFHDGRVMLATYSGQLSASDVLHASTEHAEQALRLPKPVHAIADSRQVTGLPPNVLGLLQRNVKRIQHIERGVYVVVTQNRTVVVILNTFAKLVPGTEFRFVRTLDEAWHIVNQVLDKEKSA